MVEKTKPANRVEASKDMEKASIPAKADERRAIADGVAAGPLTI